MGDGVPKTQGFRKTSTCVPGPELLFIPSAQSLAR